MIAASLLAFLSSSAFSMNGGSELIDVVNKANREAALHGIDRLKKDMISVRQMADSNSTYFDSSRHDAFARGFREKLSGKKYWEVCFRGAQEIGGVSCMYYERDNLNFLYVLRLK
jgi:hypothetical protein